MNLNSAEEAFKKHKSRIKWLSLGDKNTKFFHHKMAAHTLRNKILCLNDKQGNRLDNPLDIQNEILDYYQGLLRTPFPGHAPALEELRASVRTPVHEEHWWAGLIQPLSEAEILAALKSIKGDKAPGPDGYNSAFTNKIGIWLGQIL